MRVFAAVKAGKGPSISPDFHRIRFANCSQRDAVADVGKKNADSSP